MKKKIIDFMKKFLFLLFFYSILSEGKSVPNNELSLYFIPSPFGIDWTTPSTLAVTAAKNKFGFKSHFMGHVWVEIKCQDQHEFTGMVGDDPDYLNQLILKERGFGVLYHSFKGRLEEKKDIEAELKELTLEGRINFVTFKLNENQCRRSLDYLSQYRTHNVGRYYGLAHRPRHGEGSGCSAFGASFLDVLKLLDQDMKDSWSSTINIPHTLAGPPLSDEGVSLLKIFSHRKSWAKENEKHHKLTFWDPDKMFNWVKEKIQNKGFTETVKIQNAQGIILDKSHLPSPEGPIWLQRL